MSLTLLPAVDVRDGKAVRLRQGESGSETDYGSPLEAARTWVESGAEWIHLVDLDAAFGTGNNRDQLRAIVTFKIRTDNSQTGIFSRSTRVRLQADTCKSGNNLQVLAQIADQFTISFRLIFRHQRMHAHTFRTA